MADRVRFGVNLMGTGSGAEFLDRVRAAADAGVDVVMVPDHLGFIAPMPALVAAAAVAPRLRLGTFVLNAGFYRPALLIRDLATLDQLTDGRLEIGLGAGYVEAEFDRAGIPFGTAGQRVSHLEQTLDQLIAAREDPELVPSFVQSPTPIMLAGSGNRVLSIAARKADIVALSAIPSREVLVERAQYVWDKAADRETQPELNIIIFDLAIDREPNLEALRSVSPGTPDEALLGSMNGLSGSPEEVADHIRDLQAQTGLSYFTAIEPSDDDLRGLARVIDLLREP